MNFTETVVERTYQELWHQPLRRSACESGRLCRGDGHQARGNRRWRVPSVGYPHHAGPKTRGAPSPYAVLHDQSPPRKGGATS